MELVRDGRGGCLLVSAVDNPVDNILALCLSNSRQLSTSYPPQLPGQLSTDLSTTIICGLSCEFGAGPPLHAP